MKRSIYTLALQMVITICMLFVPIFSQAQINGLVQGKLPNGLTYYILRDPSNAGEVNFYLYQNVGAIL